MKTNIKENINMTKPKHFSISEHPNCEYVIYILIVFYIQATGAFNVDTKNVKVFRGPSGIYFGYSLAMLRNNFGNWVLVGAPKANDPLQGGIESPGVLLRCPLDGASIQCEEVRVDTTGNSQVMGSFYGSTKVFEHDKNNEWLGVAVDVSPNNDRIVICAHRWKDSKYVAANDLLYMHGLCYELDANFQFGARLLPIIVDYNSLVHRQERYPIWAYGSLGQSVQYTKNGDALVMGAPGLNDWQGGFVIEDNLQRNFTVQPFPEDRQNWLIGYAVATARLIRSDVNYIIAGAPRAHLNGAVYIFEFKSSKSLKAPLIGDQLGSYFGSVLCAVDVNGDQLDDIIVGAPYYSTNNTEEGRVFVYTNSGMLNFDRQTNFLNGSASQRARFGSAIANIGDINRDSYYDVAIGAPYENDGEGAVYIYNGYSGGLWSRYTQRIGAADVGQNILSFGAALSSKSVNLEGVFAVGAHDSDSVIVLRTNPVVSIEMIMYVRPDRITASGPHLDVIPCFKYTGVAASLPSNLGLTYVMLVDTSTPQGSIRAIVIPNNVPYIYRTVHIRKDEFVCDQNIRVYAPYQDIWRNVDLEVKYELEAATTSQCVKDCPILERFNGRDPQSSTQDVFKKVIQYDKQCGSDNICETGLSLKVVPLTSRGYIVAGQDRYLDVKVGLINNGENAYNIIMDILIAGNVSTVRIHDTEGDALVDCDSFNEMSSTHVTYQCRVRKPYPLKHAEELTFIAQFSLENYAFLKEFEANFSVRTEDQNRSLSSQTIFLPIKSEYGLKIEGISGPEQVTLGLTQETDAWITVEHRYSIKNIGPSPLESAEIFTHVPVIIYSKEPLVSNISTWLTTYETDPPVKQRCLYAVEERSIPHSDSPGGYAIRVDCSSFPCQRFSCNLITFTKDRSILVSVNMTVSRQLLSKLQARDSVELVSRVSIGSVLLGQSLQSEVETIFHKTTNAMERKKMAIPIWLIIVSVVSAFFVLLVIVAILIKVGFFKRSKKEEMKRLMGRQNSSAFTSDANTSIEHSNFEQETSGNSKITKSSEKCYVDSEHYHKHAHDNPVTDSDVTDDTNPSDKNIGFQNDSSNVTNNYAYKKNTDAQ